MAFDLTGKAALITGSSSGIGAKTAEVLARAGAKVFLHGTSDEKLAAVAGDLAGLGLEAPTLPLDLTTNGAAAELVEAALGKMGGLDIVVNSAGINRPQPAAEVTMDNWDAVMNINLRSLFLVCQAAGRHMIAQGSGRIINVSSQAGAVALPLRAAYCSSKGAVNQLTRCLALEWAPHGVTVNAVAPTFVETPLVTNMFKDSGFKRYVLDSIPMGRMATVDEVAHACLYLASDEAHIVTGHILSVDGGWTIK